VAWLYHGPALVDILGPPFVSPERRCELDLLLRSPLCGKHNVLGDTLAQNATG
jgi:hypothetical protein